MSMTRQTPPFIVTANGCAPPMPPQPLAVTMNGGVCLVIDIDGTRLARRVETRYLDEIAPDLASAVRRATAAKAAG
ncbi:MAG: hypothetical protein EB027_06860, partial [Actinobacteria bacterium]|nr:hypothetical protein [Actinomycetota bacterium]